MPGQAHGGTADGVWGDLKEAAAKQAKRGRAEKARERVWGAVVGGAKVDTDCGRCQRKSKGQT